MRIEGGIALLLPPPRVQALLEVAGAVQQPHPEDRNPEVGGRLEVVASQNSQTPGVLREHFGDTELRGEVRDRLGGSPAATGTTSGSSGRSAGRCAARRAARERGVLRQLGEPLRTDLAEQPHRVVVDGLPRRGVDAFEQVEARVVPGPPQVHDQLGQRARAEPEGPGGRTCGVLSPR